jgi:stigma-specific protein Stig1
MFFGRVQGLAAAFIATSILVSQTAEAIPDTYTLSNTSGVTTAYCCGNPVAVDPGVSVAASLNLTGATVSIGSGFVPSEDVLALPSPVGAITASYSAATGVLTLSGSDTAANYQLALGSVTYSDTATVPSTSPRTVTFGLGAAVPYSGTGHFYEFVMDSLTWTDAETAAAARSYLGLSGYLATITSAGENAFVLQKASGDGWLGASTNGMDGFPRTWYWVTGPEAGESFFSNTGPGQGTTSGMNIPYANWNGGEPNDSGGAETVGEFYGNGGTSGFWNDLAPTSGGVEGYFCEYGGQASDPVESLQGSKTLVFLGTAITLTSSANPTEPGASVTFTATISPVPTSGTVTFSSSDSTMLGGPVAISGGIATVTTSALTTGADTISASASYMVAGNNLTASTTLDEVVQVSCPSGESACPTASPTFCTDELTDSYNCGACGTVCPSGKVCDGTGHCVIRCVARETNCSGLCTITNSDDHNCGACGTVCPSGEVCDGTGHCAVSCVAGEANCSGLCTITNSDNHNCGACGTVCPSGEVCDGTGHCAVSCVAGEANCSGLCTITNSDNHNCGACGTVCPSGEVCDGTGHCAVSCVAGETNCSGLCTITNTDNHNCGACGKLCPSGEVCDGTGHCAVSCVAGEISCAGECIDLNQDALNCGACGTVCAGKACSAGVCAPVEAGAIGDDSGAADAMDASAADASPSDDSGNSNEAGGGATDASTADALPSDDAGNPIEAGDGATDASTADASPSDDSGNTTRTGGCNCRSIPSGPTQGTAISFALLALALACRRRSNVGR